MNPQGALSASDDGATSDDEIADISVRYPSAQQWLVFNFSGFDFSSGRGDGIRRFTSRCHSSLTRKLYVVYFTL
jgi:hypothetical protein